MWGGMTERCERSISVLIMSLIPKIAPIAKTPIAMLKTVSSVRVLLCQRSNQTLLQMTPISGSCPAFLDILLLVGLCGLQEDVASDFGLAQELIELCIRQLKHLH